MKFLMYLSIFPGFLVALTVHEAAHALVSKWLGDNYAQKQGRISLNPMRHLSALGTLMLFFVGFGWGKPVPVNLYNYRHPKFYYLLSSLAGPASNILLCLISLAMVFGLNFICRTEQGQTDLSKAGYLAYTVLWFFFYTLLYINVVLAVINLMPIPPLDGSKIWPCLIPGLRPSYSGKTMIIWIVVLIIAMQGDIISKATGPAIDFVNGLMPEMLEKQESMPDNFPVEMQAPKGSRGVHYTQTRNDNSEPSLFSASFVLDKTCPVQEYRTQLIENMDKSGWRLSNMIDPVKWDTNEIIIDEDEQYRAAKWQGIWEKENTTFNVDIIHYSDPNKQNQEEWSIIEYKYTIQQPKQTQ
jgi:Zn-dependent protease